MSLHYNLGECTCRPLKHYILENSGLEVFACIQARAVIQSHSGGPLECGGQWTHAIRLPRAHQKLFNLQMLVTKVFDDQFKKENEVLTWRRRRLVREPRFEKMRVPG